jgi:hypothetical protein
MRVVFSGEPIFFRKWGRIRMEFFEVEVKK